MPRATVIIPTQRRAQYLDVALASILPQAAAHGAGVLVVDDGGDAATQATAARHGAEVLVLDPARGLNGARNAAAAHVDAELLVYVDDDVRVRPGWLAALLEAHEREPPDVGVLTGPIVARIEDHAYRTCGREGLPITFLDLGRADTDAPHAWGANMTIRRSALDRIGPFDEALGLYGDEQEWQARLLAAGGRMRYIAAAALEHRRAGRRRAAALAGARRVVPRQGEPSLRRREGREPVARGRAARPRRLHRPRPAAALHERAGPRRALRRAPARGARWAGMGSRPRRPAWTTSWPGAAAPWAGAATSCAGWPTSRWTPRRCRAGCARPRGPERRRILVVGIRRPGRLMDDGGDRAAALPPRGDHPHRRHRRAWEVRAAARGARRARRRRRARRLAAPRRRRRRAAARLPGPVRVHRRAGGPAPGPAGPPAPLARRMAGHAGAIRARTCAARGSSRSAR